MQACQITKIAIKYHNISLLKYFWIAWLMQKLNAQKYIVQY